MIEAQYQNGGHDQKSSGRSEGPCPMQKAWEGEKPSAEVLQGPAAQSNTVNLIWAFVSLEWKWLFALIFPLLLGGGYLAFPASTATVEKVKTAAAAELALVKSEVFGQFKVVTSRIDELKEAGAETRNDIKELLRRIPAYRSDLPPPPAASAPPALSPAANPPYKNSTANTPRKHPAPKRPEAVKKPCTGLLCRW
jgi:hypothetical protein